MPAPQPRRVRVATLAFVFVVTGCDEETSTRPALTPMTAVAPAATAGSPAARKSDTELQLPDAARNAPPEAMRGPNGIRWLTLAPGSGAQLDKSSTVWAELTIWSGTGELAFSTYRQHGQSVFSMNTPQPFLRQQLQTLSIGGKARAWLPPGTAGVWAPPAWRPKALIVEIEIVRVAATPATTTQVLGAPKPDVARRPYAFPLPDAAGPPAEASFVANGVRMLRLEDGSGPVATSADRLRLEISAWPRRGIMLAEPLLYQQQTTTTAAHAPQPVAAVLLKMRLGESVRLWLPAKVATALLPVAANSETVVDLTLVAVN